ncbi:hypothetical protein D3C86_1654820 [compost metagenome]
MRDRRGSLVPGGGFCECDLREWHSANGLVLATTFEGSIDKARRYAPGDLSTEQRHVLRIFERRQR